MGMERQKVVSCVTHVNAQAHKVVRVEEVICDWLNQVERQLNELERCTCIGGGKDNPTWIVQHRYVCCQYHLSVKVN